jgi:hypothetical protein
MFYVAIVICDTLITVSAGLLVLFQLVIKGNSSGCLSQHS